MMVFRRKAAPEPGKHDALRAADPYDFRVAHRRLAWLFRLSVATNITLLGALAIMASAFSAILPLKEVRVALLRSDAADNRLYRVEPISQEVAGFELLLEQKARRFVQLVVEIDAPTQGARLQEAWRVASRDYYEKYKAARIDSGAIQDALDSGLVRSAVIESASLITVDRGVWKYGVDFRQVDRRDGEILEERSLRAYISLTTRPHEVSEADKYENPLGVYVIDMAIKERGAAT